ncbi:MAG: PLDc N-terminal domain-containing protein [Chloroflexota bacterium]|nr:PLDc N-terminal domain-containing protein [Chloroflexota bacterium]
MFLFEFFPEIGEIGSFLVTIFWIWMLIDCFRNRSLHSGQRTGWLLFIFFTHIFGAVFYFVFHCVRRSPFAALTSSQTRTRHYQPQPQPQPHSAPHASPPAEKPYTPYQQGYQEDRTSQEYQEYHTAEEHKPEVQVTTQQFDTPQPQYEQTLVSYPEMPQQQQH